MNRRCKIVIHIFFIAAMAGVVSCSVHSNQARKMENLNITNPENQNIELGKVTWYRNYEDALQKSKETGKPILLFFQEIPGCATCVNYGRNVLSHPLMVDLIENEFVPLAIYNNKPGKDAEILQFYNEPSWNNPVAHFIDDTGKDIIPKLEDNYEPISMLTKIMEALKKKGKQIPAYANLLEKDLTLAFGYTKSRIYETPCFWSGETSLAQQKSVISTSPGFANSKEVVKIVYDPSLSTEAELDNFAEEQGFFKTDPSAKFRKDADEQYYLKQSLFRFLPLTPAQRSKINQALPYKENAEKYLSPAQVKWLHHPELSDIAPQDNYTLDFAAAWNNLKSRL